MTMSFDDLVMRAAGHEPYPYQQRIATEGLPELLRVPTGAGKTLAATLPWLFRRRFHAEGGVRTSTPHWLVLVLPMRVLVEQTFDVVRAWVEALGLQDELPVHVVMGGEGRLESSWRREPERDAIFVGTLDMLLSRSLNRAYGEGRFAWPIDFGLFNNGCHFVFDEVQLMGPALPTSRQLQGLRDVLGTAIPCSSTWMSATVDLDSLVTVDLPDVGPIVELSEEDAIGGLRRRLDATKRVEEVDVGDDPRRAQAGVADALSSRHRPGTLTLAVCNTVSRAQDLYRALAGTDAELVLLHSRYRPPDRRVHADAALRPVDPHGPGRIVVSTQVIEAGVDLSAATLLTEAAPWSSVVQRAGRCNRAGEHTGSTLLWVVPPSAAPYSDEDVAASVAALRELEGETVTAPGIGAREVPQSSPVHPVLRRRDLLGLFDTTPDLSGNDLDVGRFLRDVDDRDVQVAWRAVPAGPQPDDPSPARDELCAVPIAGLRGLLKNHELAWRFDHLTGRWVRARATDLYAGMVLVLDSTAGGYDPVLGWVASSRAAVEPLGAEPGLSLSDVAESAQDDPVTFTGMWVRLRDHLEDVEHAVRELGADLRPALPGEICEAVGLAGRFHDVGKAHPVFQETLLGSVDEEERRRQESGVPWAKSHRTRRSRHRRRYFRHELVSALALLDAGGEVLTGVEERDLVVYLVGAHHGRVRLGIRSLPEEDPHEQVEGGRVALGVHDGEELAAVEIPGGVVPSTTLDLSVMELGMGPDGRRSWTQMALGLLERIDLGPFRLGFCEAWLRLADWRASARGEEVRP